MRAVFLPLAIVAGVMLAGCNGDVVAAPRVTIGLITPGTWVVDGSPDYMLVWIHNEMRGSTRVRWDVALADGSPLPDGWTVARSRDGADLQPKGSKQTGPAGPSYPDWQWSRLSLQLPAGTTPGEHRLRIDSGHGVHEFTLKVNGTATRVSRPGDHVVVEYDGRFDHNGTRFDAGDFDTTLGSGGTVTGFDNGLMGLMQGENATLVIPPALAYGYDQTDPSRVKFNGRALRFEVRIREFL